MRYLRHTPQSIESILAQIKETLESTTNTLADGKEIKIPTTIKGEKAQLYFSLNAYLRIRALVNECVGEVGWHCTVVRGEMPHSFIVQEVLVYPQTVTSSTVKTDDLEYAQWAAKLDDETFNSLRFHGHSHVNMTTNPSGVDTEYQKNLLEQVEDFYIFTIQNKKDSLWAAIYDLENNILYESTDIEIKLPNTEVSKAALWAKDEVEQQVKKYVAPVTTVTTGYNRTQVGTNYSTASPNSTPNPVVDNTYHYGMEWDYVNGCWDYPTLVNYADFALKLSDKAIFKAGVNGWGMHLTSCIAKNRTIFGDLKQAQTQAQRDADELTAQRKKKDKKKVGRPTGSTKHNKKLYVTGAD